MSDKTKLRWDRMIAGELKLDIGFGVKLHALRVLVGLESEADFSLSMSEQSVAATVTDASPLGVVIGYSYIEWIGTTVSGCDSQVAWTEIIDPFDVLSKWTREAVARYSDILDVNTLHGASFGGGNPVPKGWTLPETITPPTAAEMTDTLASVGMSDLTGFFGQPV
jgi:hypothetical protein